MFLFSASPEAVGVPLQLFLVSHQALPSIEGLSNFQVTVILVTLLPDMLEIFSRPHVYVHCRVIANSYLFCRCSGFPLILD